MCSWILPTNPRYLIVEMFPGFTTIVTSGNDSCYKTILRLMSSLMTWHSIEQNENEVRHSWTARVPTSWGDPRIETRWCDHFTMQVQGGFKGCMHKDVWTNHTNTATFTPNAIASYIIISFMTQLWLWKRHGLLIAMNAEENVKCNFDDKNLGIMVTNIGDHCAR